MSRRIVLHLDNGLGWTKPLVVAGCRACGTELARHPDPAAAERAAGRRRCPACGTRTARRLPGTTSLATDLAGSRRAGHRTAPSPEPSALEGGEDPMPASRSWLTASEAARRLQVSPKTIARWAKEGRLAHRRTLGATAATTPS